MLTLIVGYANLDSGLLTLIVGYANLDSGLC